MKPKIVKGHEIWLEYVGGRAHQNEKIDVSINFGHAMKTDEILDVTKLNISTIDPDGIKREAELTASKKGISTSFIPEKDGLYTVLAEYDAGIYTVTKDGKWHKGSKKNYENVKNSSYYFLYAQIAIPVGHCHAAENIPIGNELEIIPKIKHFHVSDEIALNVLYEGKPVKTEVNATYSGFAGKDYAVKTKTDSEGKVKIKLNKPGNWMFLVKHEDTDKGTEDYDKKVIVSVITIMNVS